MHLKDIRGQVSVMISVMMTTFILFFAFVINTGMLVNAKINLQNAADLAAYAGASVQARQLTHISYLNYEMRRQWKKFLYRLYVLGNMSYDSFPPGGGTTGKMTYIPNLRVAGDGDFAVPTTCVSFGNDNRCRLLGSSGSLPAITIPPANFMDPITDVLRGQLQAIEHIRQDNCKQSGTANMLLNTYWLFNTDPSFTALRQQANLATTQNSQLQATNLIQQWAPGLGIVPKEVLLKMRIRTLEHYVNTPAQRGVTASKVSQFGSSVTTAPAYERSISAFNSAYYTLGNFTFNGGSIELDELLPPQILLLKELKTPFDTYAIDAQLAPDGSCISVVYNIPVTTPLTLGFYKDPKFLTYYAIRLKAQAQILFSPFGPLDLQAYAVAQPFGSRIGPSTMQMFSFDPARSGYGNSTKNFPSVSVQEGDPSQPSAGRGWNTRDIIYALAQASGAIAGSSVLDPNIGYQLAMTPNPWEAKRYNIINDVGQDAFIKNFGSGPATIWAPLSPNGEDSASINSAITEAIGTILTPQAANTISAGSSGNYGSTAAIQGALATGLKTYVGKLVAGQGETGEGFREGFNVAKISNPYQRVPTTGLGSVFTMDPRQIKSSWNQVKDPNFAAQGRVGYSVKFVSFSSIEKNITSNDENASVPLNGPTSIGDTGLETQVFPFIKH